MKKIISLFICVIVLVSTLSISTSASANNLYTDGDYEFNIIDKKVTIRNYIGSEKVVEIPSSIKGYPVVGLGAAAFLYCDFITNITIPQEVTTIEAQVFYGCTSLKSIVVPSQVTSIGYHAFYGCSSLKNIILPDGVESIREDAFYNTAYYNDKTNWENGVLYISNHLIEAGDHFITTYTVKPGTITVADCAFKYHELLEEISFPTSILYIGEESFYKCTSLKSVSFPNSLLKIDVYAFGYCENLSNVALGKSITSIGNYAFFDCISLTTITMPVSLNNIGKGVFGKSPYSSQKQHMTIYGYSGSYVHEHMISNYNDFDFIFVSLGCYKHSCKWKTAKKPKCLKEYKCEYCNKVLEKKYNHSYSWKTTRKATIFQRGEKKYKCAYCGKIAKTKYIAKKKVNKPKLKFYKRSETLNVSWTGYSGKETIYVRYRRTNSKKWTTKKWKTFELDDLKPGKNYYIQARLKVTKNGKVAKSDWSKRIKIKLASNYDSSSGSSSNNSSGNPSTSYSVYITPYGSKYHFSKSCAGSNAIETTLESARSSHDPCKKCAQ